MVQYQFNLLSRYPLGLLLLEIIGIRELSMVLEIIQTDPILTSQRIYLG